VTQIGTEVLDASVVRQIAERDEVDEAAARAQAIDTLRLVAAARAEREQSTGADPAPLVTEARRAQLRRAAAARLWLDEGFEPTRRPQDIPDDDPLMQRALSNSRFVHPEVHRVCQFVAIPANAKSIDEAQPIAADPQWRTRARARLQPVVERVQRYVPPGDAEACKLMARLLSLLPEVTDANEDSGIVVRYEKEGGFDLDACAELADDGSCTQPRFDAAWTERIADTEPQTFTGVFGGTWGLHYAYLAAIEPPRLADDPETLAWIREEIHVPWLAEQLATLLERLAQKRAVRIAREAEP